jgi:hypothetical protein
MIPAHTSPIQKYLAVILLFSLTILSISVRPAYAQSSSLGQNTSQGNLIPATFTFQKNLSKGMTVYPDVVYLKKFLGQDPRTAVLADPCVSPYADGYFDQATKDAVIKFQELYRSEVLTPAGLRTASGVVGQYSRTKINALLKTSAYAPIVATSSTSTASQVNLQVLQNIVNQYLGQVNQAISNSATTTIATSTATTTVHIASTTNPIVNTYLALVQQRLSASNGTTTATSSQNIHSPIATTIDPIIAAYFQSINNTLNNNQPTATSTSTTGTTTPQTPNTNTTSTTNNPVVASYLNSVNATLRNLTTTSSSTTVSTTTSQVSTSSTSQATSTIPSREQLPRILAVSPTVLTNCQQTITIIGQNFSPTQNMLIGSLGTFVTTANTIATTSTSSIQAITLTLKDFTDYMYSQSIYAGYTREIRFTIMANGKTSDDLAVVLFTFPGEKRSSEAIMQTAAQAVSHGISSINANGGTAQTQNGSGGGTGQRNNSGNQSMLATMEQTELRILRETPQGKLITAIGGEKALQTFYGFTPTGHLNQKLQGNTLGAVSVTNSITGSSNGSQSSGSGNSGSGLFSGLAGLAAGIGISAGLNSLFGGGATSAIGSAGATSVIANFGGPLAVNFTCTCSANSLLTIQDVRGQTLQLIFQPGASILYAYGSLRPGAQVLGDYITGAGQCLIYSGVSCTPFGAPMGTIRQIGTSK